MLTAAKLVDPALDEVYATLSSGRRHAATGCNRSQA